MIALKLLNKRIVLAWAAIAWAAPGAAHADLAKDLAVLRAVSDKGQGNREAQTAWRAVAKSDVAALPQILSALDGANPLAANYLRAAVDAVAERTLAEKRPLPANELETFTLERKNDPRARRLAFEWLTRVDQAAPDRIIPKMLDDPSLELRRDAVARVLEKAQALATDGKRDPAAEQFETAFHAARHLDQAQKAAEELKKLGRPADLVKHFGFITHWKLVAPFDNTGQKGYDVAYPPEKGLDFSATYRGKQNAPIRWIDHETTDPLGKVDLTKALDKHKGAVAYAVAEFHADGARDVELRLGCINAAKVWLNGRLVIAEEVYHTGTDVDQYIGKARLEPGKNVILVKICQNEQTEDWAQTWQFQLRVCDAIGSAVLPSKP
ncbi:MAG: hypothetical protein WD468_06595 [Pirellulales bacterium]